MNFYTNVQLIGNQFLVRGYENGKYVMKREEWKPTLFVPSKRKSEYRTLEGEYVELFNLDLSETVVSSMTNTKR